MKAVHYLRERLAEPGTMRSLVWCCLSIAGLDAGDTAVTNISLAAGLVLGAVSALMPERRS